MAAEARLICNVDQPVTAKLCCVKLGSAVLDCCFNTPTFQSRLTAASLIRNCRGVAGVSNVKPFKKINMCVMHV